ncbi:MAG: bifunctional folylpolyglutamate synthase/dihydrofolate synthase [Muribaculaceae bacterium]|nr:bifunctional folylpolyglutamate synthase/dihydrofolate synthase [Muribaculaceae bacterium]
MDSTSRLAALFGNPQEGLPCIHVAGTNGKGTTSHLVASCLHAAGMKVGLYTSPHITDLRERIMVDGEMITPEEVVAFMKRYNDLFADTDLRPSFFELLTVMAFDCFRRRKVDIAVIEVGLGGRLDATNIITPKLCVITNISADHTDILGDTLEKIATEKAGIIKRGVPVVVGEADGSVLDVFSRKAAEMHSPLVVAANRNDIEVLCKGDQADIEVARSPFGAFPTALHGVYQRANATTALCALDTLGGVPADAVRQGFMLPQRGLHGRWEMCRGVLCDAGHNPAAWEYNSRYFAEHAGRLTAILGFCADKDVATIVDMLPEGVRYLCVAAHTGRALPAAELCSMMRARGLDASACGNVEQAVKTAKSIGQPIFLGGSFYVVAEFMDTDQ